MGGTRRSWRAALAAVAVCALSAVGAVAQTAGAAGVTGEGSAAIERAPELLRMQVNIAATGKTARDALASLRAQEKSAREKLAPLGASGESVKLGDVRVALPGGGAGGQQQAMLEAMIRARTGHGKVAAAATAPAAGATPPVNVSVTLTAEWPLKAPAGDERIAEAVELQAKVAAANVVTPPPAPELTPEQQEAAEEAAGMAEEMGADSSGGAAAGQPAFVFVSRISDTERAKAAAEAFTTARADAVRLAEAAGSRAGELRHLSGSVAAATDYAELQGNYFGGNGISPLQVAALQPRPGAAPAEAVGLQPAKVTYRVNVSATFALERR